LGGFLSMNDFTEVLVASPVLRGEQAERQLADLKAALEDAGPNVCLSYWSAGDLTRTQEAILAATGRPVFSGCRPAVRAIANYRRAGCRRRGAQVAAVAQASPVGLAPSASYFAVREELGRLGIPFAAAHLARDAGEAGAAGARLGFPVVMKANVGSSTHKLA